MTLAPPTRLALHAESAGLRVLASSAWPESPTDLDPPPIPGFVISTFSPLAAVTANRCLSRAATAPGRPPAGDRAAPVPGETAVAGGVSAVRAVPAPGAGVPAASAVPAAGAAGAGVAAASVVPAAGAGVPAASAVPVPGAAGAGVAAASLARVPGAAGAGVPAASVAYAPGAAGAAVPAASVVPAAGVAAPVASAASAPGAGVAVPAGAAGGGGRGVRTGVVVVSAFGDLAGAVHVAGVVDGGGRPGPLMFFQAVPNAVAGHVAARWGLEGPVVCVAGGGIEVAGLLIEDGDAEEVLVVRVEQGSDGDRAEAVLVGAGAPTSEGERL